MLNSVSIHNTQILTYTMVGDYINTIKTTFSFNLLIHNTQILTYTMVGDYINTIKTTFSFNLLMLTNFLFE